jgi:hypothetical protein
MLIKAIDAKALPHIMMAFSENRSMTKLRARDPLAQANRINIEIRYFSNLSFNWNLLAVFVVFEVAWIMLFEYF